LTSCLLHGDDATIDFNAMKIVDRFFSFFCILKYYKGETPALIRVRIQDNLATLELSILTETSFKLF